MAKKIIINETTPSKQEIKIIEALSFGYSASEIANDASMKLGMSERQVYWEINKAKLTYRCKNVPHLVAAFLRSKIID